MNLIYFKKLRRVSELLLIIIYIIVYIQSVQYRLSPIFNANINTIPEKNYYFPQKNLTFALFQFFKLFILLKFSD